MDYYEMIRRVRKLDFIRDEQTAAAAVKAVLRVFASRMNEEHARKITGKLGAYALVDAPGGDQKQAVPLSVAEHIADIRTQFRLSVHQSRILVRNVLYFVKEASGDGVLAEIRQSLPVDWAEALHNA